MPQLQKYPKPGRPWRPREFLRYAETLAASIRKLLTQRQVSGSPPRHPASKDDALNLARLIEAIASKGRQGSAADAIETAERVEFLIDLLKVEVDDILAS
jgi:hypothetical protein